MKREGMATVFKSKEDLINALVSLSKLKKGDLFETDLGTCVFLGLSRDMVTGQITYDAYFTRELFDKEGNTYHVPDRAECSLGAMLSHSSKATQLDPSQIIDPEDADPTESEQ